MVLYIIFFLLISILIYSPILTQSLNKMSRPRGGFACSEADFYNTLVTDSVFLLVICIPGRGTGTAGTIPILWLLSYKRWSYACGNKPGTGKCQTTMSWNNCLAQGLTASSLWLELKSTEGLSTELAHHDDFSEYSKKREWSLCGISHCITKQYCLTVSSFVLSHLPHSNLFACAFFFPSRHQEILCDSVTLFINSV